MHHVWADPRRALAADAPLRPSADPPPPFVVAASSAIPRTFHSRQVGDGFVGLARLPAGVVGVAALAASDLVMTTSAPT